MDEELQCENPAWAPDAQHYLNEDPVDKQDQQDQHEPISHNDALEQLLRIQKSNFGNTRLFDITESAMTRIQNKTTVSEITSKSKQSSIVKYFKF